MLKRILGLIVFMVCFVWLSYTAEAGPNMKEGLWQITVTMDMPGMPMQMPPQTFTHCLTKKDMIPQKEEPNQDCKIIKYDVKGDTVTWVVECKDPEGTTVGNGKATYKGTTFDGVVKVKAVDMEITQKLNGKWIGQCK